MTRAQRFRIAAIRYLFFSWFYSRISIVGQGEIFLFAAGLLLRHLFHHFVEVKARGVLGRGEFPEASEPLSDHGLRRNEEEGTMRLPVGVVNRIGAALERIGAQVVQVGRTQVGELALPDTEWRFRIDFRVLLE